MSTEPRLHRPVDSEPSVGAILEQLIRERGEQLRRVAGSIAGPAQAEDAVQNACLGFLRWYDPATSYDGLDGAFRYLATATANSAAKLLRGDRRRTAGLPPVSRADPDNDPLERVPSRGPEPLDAVIRHQDVAKARAALAELPTDWRTIVVARAAGFGPGEIQRSAGLTDRQYRKRIEKANRLLGESRGS